jgi:hypothetical protein
VRRVGFGKISRPPLREPFKDSAPPSAVGIRNLIPNADMKIYRAIEKGAKVLVLPLIVYKTKRTGILVLIFTDFPAPYKIPGK